MKLSELNDNTTLLIQSENLNEIRLALLPYQKKGIHISSLQQYLNAFSVSQLQLAYQCYDHFKRIQNQCTLFKENLLTPAFIEECLTFLNQIHAYKINIDQLPTISNMQKELKLILSQIFDLETSTKASIHRIETIQDASNLAILIKQPNSLQSHYIRLLMEKGATLIEEFTESTYQYHYANNARLEVESVAQSILANQQNANDTRLAVCDAKYFNLIKQVFSRYEIPVNISQEKQNNPLIFQTVALLRFSLNPSVANFNECLNQNCFGIRPFLIQAQNLYNYEYKQVFPTFDIEKLKNRLFSEQELNQYQYIIKRATQEKEEIIPFIEKLLADDKTQKLLNIDELLRKFQLAHVENVAVLNKIQVLFKEALPFIHEISDYEILIQAIQKISITSKNNKLNQLNVSLVNSCSLVYKNLYILGATQNKFPNFKGMSGIFNEDYVSLIKNFPTLDKRYQEHLQIAMKLFSCASATTISYPSNDYTNKTFESSLEIDRLVQVKPTLFPLQQYKKANQTIDNINSALSKQLFTNNNVIHVSVSSLEKYVGCPYAYFLRYGCKLYEPISIGFNPAKTGTLNHAILEDLVKTHQKQYPLVDETELKSIIDDYLNDMETVFPHMNFELLRRKCLLSMQNNLKFFKDFEEHSSMIPTFTEQKFNVETQIEDTQMRLTGYVDRIDCDTTTFAILDYKSSEHRLDPKKVFSGQQLQLCTYASFMEEQLSKRALGAFYVNLKNSNIALPTLRRERGKIIERDEETIQAKELTSHKLRGWYFEEGTTSIDNNKAHISGSRTTWTMAEIRGYVLEMLQLIVTDILSGKMLCEPNEIACSYCPYKSICRYNGAYNEKKLLVKVKGMEDDLNENVE